MPSLVITVPTGGVRRDVEFSVLLAARTDNVALGALVARFTLPTHLFTFVSLTGLAFDGPDDTGLSFHGPTGSEGLLKIAGARLAGAPGELQIALLRLKHMIAGPVSLPINVEVLSAAATNGLPLKFDPQVVLIPVDPGPLKVELEPVPDAHADVPYHFGLRATGGREPFRWSVLSGALPPGLTLDSSGLITGTPAQSGTSVLHALVTDSSSPTRLSASAELTLRVLVGPLRIETESLPSAAPGHPYSFALLARGGVQPVKWRATGLPTGLTLQDGIIRGALTTPPTDYQSIEVEVEAEDSNTPPQVAKRTLSLPLVALQPKVEIEINAPVAVAVGRDLMLAKYKVELSANLIRPPRDMQFEGLISDMQAAILEEVFMSDFDASRRVGVPGPTGPGDPPDIWADLPPSGRGSRGTRWRPDEGVPTGPDDRPLRQTGRNTRKEELLLWYKTLNEWKDGRGQIVSYDIAVSIDGDRIVDTTVGFGQTGLTSVRGAVTLAANSSSLMSVRTSPNDGGRSPGTFRVALFSILRRPVLAWARSRADRLLAESKRHPVGADASAAQASGEQTFSFSSEGFRDLNYELMVRRQARLSLAPFFWTAAATVAFAGALIGDLIGLVAVALPILTFLAVGSAILVSNVVTKFRDLIAVSPDVVVSLANDFAETGAEVQLTPGAHVITVRWNRSAFGETGSPYGAIRSFETSFAWRLNLTPDNPFNWPRLAGSTNLHGGGHGDGSVNIPISLYSSALDLIVQGDDGKLHLVAAKGDGSFDEPKLFSSEVGAGAKFVIRRIDPYGRSSIVAAEGLVVTLIFNDGVRGFGVRRMPAGTSNEDNQIYSVDAADLDGDSWAELVLGMNGKIKVLSQRLPSGYEIEGGSSISREPVEAILCNEKLGLTSSSPPAGGFAHIAALRRLSGQVLILENLQGQFERKLIDGLTMPNPRLQPIALSLVVVIPEREYLAIALRQTRQIKLWRRVGPAWELEKNVDLPFHPGQLVMGPESTHGLITVDHRGQVALLIKWIDADQPPSLLLVQQGIGPTYVSSCEGTLAISQKLNDRVFIYQ